MMGRVFYARLLRDAALQPTNRQITRRRRRAAIETQTAAQARRGMRRAHPAKRNMHARKGALDSAHAMREENA